MILWSEVKILNRVKVFDKSEFLEDHFGEKSPLQRVSSVQNLLLELPYMNSKNIKFLRKVPQRLKITRNAKIA